MEDNSTDMTMPYTFQQLNSTFNTITYTFVQGATTITDTITIDPGSPNIYALLTLIKDALEASLVFHGISTLFTFTYDKSDFHVSLGFKSEPLVSSVTWDNTKLNLMLGFDIPVSFTNTVPHESTLPVNVSPVSNLYFRTNFKMNSYKQVDGKTSVSDILLKIPILYQSGSIIQFNAKMLNSETLIFDNHFSEITLRITDEDNNLVNILLDYSITLHFELVQSTQPKLQGNNSLDLEIPRTKEPTKEPTSQSAGDLINKLKKDIDNNIKQLQAKKESKAPKKTVLP